MSNSFVVDREIPPWAVQGVDRQEDPTFDFSIDSSGPNGERRSAEPSLRPPDPGGAASASTTYPGVPFSSLSPVSVVSDVSVPVPVSVPVVHSVSSSSGSGSSGYSADSVLETPKRKNSNILNNNNNIISTTTDNNYKIFNFPISTEIKYNNLGVPILPNPIPYNNDDIVPIYNINNNNYNNNNNNNNIVEKCFGTNNRYPMRSREPSSKALENIANTVLAAIEAEQEDIDSEEPRNYNEAIGSRYAKEWLAAMQEEYNALISNKTWELVLRNVVKHRGYNIISGKWVYKIKRDSSGSIVRFKARWVARGYAQIEGVDYVDTFSPTASLKTLRVLLALVAACNLYTRHIDIKNAYLHGVIEEDIYMKQPIGFEVKPAQSKDSYVCKLEKGLYGLKQAGRQWNLKLLDVIVNLGFVQCMSDSCLFVKQQNKELIILLVFVDDILIVSNLPVLINIVVRQLANAFTLSDLGPVSWFLGFKIDLSPHCVIMSQASYCRNIVQRFGFESCNASRVPSRTDLRLSYNHNNSPITYAYSYPSAIGSLIYAVCGTRIDLSSSVSSVARFMSNPSIEHYRAVDVIFRYLAHTCDLSLRYCGNNMNLVGLCDATWGEDLDDRKSVSGFVFLLNGAPVAWSTQKQPTVALSTQEAEYMSMSAACRELVWLRSLLKELGFPQQHPTKLYVDNKPAIALAKDPVQHKRNKHIDIRHHYVRELIKDKKVSLEWLSTSDMLADFLTKPLGYNKFSKCRNSLMYNKI